MFWFRLYEVTEGGDGNEIESIENAQTRRKPKVSGLAYIHVYAYTNANFLVYVYGLRVCIGVFGCM